MLRYEFVILVSLLFVASIATASAAGPDTDENGRISDLTQALSPGAYPAQPQSPGAYPTQPQSPGAYPTQPQSPGAYPTQPQSPYSGGIPVITPELLNGLQWQQDPSGSGMLIAWDQTQGLMFGYNPDYPDILVILAPDGTFYGYIISTGTLLRYDPATGSFTAVTQGSAPAQPQSPGAYPAQPQSPYSGGIPMITPELLNGLQWQQDPSGSGTLIAWDQTQGLIFGYNPDNPDILVIQTADGTIYGYIISTGTLLRYDPATGSFTAVTQGSSPTPQGSRPYA
ncbi:hypothetical protein [Methanoculleus sp.]|uniref:hypothetical protein n=1 Tax=Methanoculleus sp. TaxID=90427 RepID=UPI00320F1471